MSVTPRQLNEDDAELLRKSEDSRQLKRTAVAFAASDRAEDHAELARQLMSESFLKRLDKDEDYQGTYTGLRLARVMKNLMDKRLASTEQVLLQLIDSSAFQGHVLRMQLEVRALAEVRPSPPNAVKYWDKLCTPNSPIAYDVIQALCINQSEPAMVLLERKCCDPAHDKLEKLSWMRELILPRRNDEPLLRVCGHMVVTSLPVELRPHLVESLFDYQPDEWYIECEPPEPPALTMASPTSKDYFFRIAEYALEKLPLKDRLRASVKAAMTQLRPEDNHS